MSLLQVWFVGDLARNLKIKLLLVQSLSNVIDFKIFGKTNKNKGGGISETFYDKPIPFLNNDAH